MWLVSVKCHRRVCLWGENFCTYPLAILTKSFISVVQLDDFGPQGSMVISVQNISGYHNEGGGSYWHLAWLRPGPLLTISSAQTASWQEWPGPTSQGQAESPCPHPFFSYRLARSHLVPPPLICTTVNCCFDQPLLYISYNVLCWFILLRDLCVGGSTAVVLLALVRRVRR